MHVQAVEQVLVVQQRLLRALVGQLHGEGQGGVGQREGRRAGDAARHVGHAVVDDAVHFVGRVLVGGGLRGLEAAALVDRHIHQHRAGTHQLQLVARDELGRRGAGNQHRADHQVGVGQALFDGVAGGVDGGQLVAVQLVQVLQAVERAVEDGDVRVHAHRHARGVDAHHAAADHQHFGRLHAGHAAEQHAGTALRFLQRMRAGLDRHAAGHFRHRRQQRQAALAVGDGLVGDAGGAGGDQRLGLFRIGCKVQVGVEHLAGAQHGALVRLRLLDLDDHVGAGKDLLGRVDDLRAGLDVLLVGQADGLAAVALDDDLVAVRNQFARTGRRKADAVFVVLYFLGDANQHVALQ